MPRELWHLPRSTTGILENFKQILNLVLVQKKRTWANFQFFYLNRLAVMYESNAWNGHEKISFYSELYLHFQTSAIIILQIWQQLHQNYFKIFWNSVSMELPAQTWSSSGPESSQKFVVIAISLSCIIIISNAFFVNYKQAYYYF